MEPEEFILAAEAGNIEKVKTGLNEGIDVNSSIQYGQTALMKASMSGKLEAVKLLVEKGADVNLFSQLQWTALCFAATRDHYDVVDALLEAGANPNVVCQDDCTILEWIIRQQDDRVGMFEHLLAHGAEIRPKTLVVARNNREEGILRLIERKSNQPANQASSKNEEDTKNPGGKSGRPNAGLMRRCLGQ